MGKWLLLLFTVIPLVEVYLLFWVGSLVGFWPTVGIVLATGMLGAALAKREGFRVMQQWQRDLNEGRVPADGVIGGLLILVGGVLLVTPGVLTDLVGLSLLVPFTRRLLVRFLQHRLERGIASGRVQVMGDVGAAGFGGFGGSPFGGSPFGGSPFGGSPFGGSPNDGAPRGGAGAVVVDVDGEELPLTPDPELPG